MFLLAPVITFYDWALQPVPLLAWLGVPVSTLDVLGAFRLAIALRQVREVYYDQHVAKAAASGHSRAKSGGRYGGKTSQRAASDELPEPRTRVRDFLSTLVIVHGGEAIVGTSRLSIVILGMSFFFALNPWLNHLFASTPAAPWLGLQPSFFISKTSSLSFLGAHVLVDLLPSLPPPSLQTEVPLTLVHAFFRSILLCNVIPRVVASNASPAVAASSFTLLLTAWVSGPVPPQISPSLIIPFANRKSRSCQMEGPSSPTFSPFCDRRRLRWPPHRSCCPMAGRPRISGRLRS